MAIARLFHPPSWRRRDGNERHFRERRLRRSLVRHIAAVEHGQVDRTGILRVLVDETAVPTRHRPRSARAGSSIDRLG